MRYPRDIVSTMYSNTALQLIASGDNLVNAIVRAIGATHVPVIGWIINYIANMVRSAWNNLISLLAPGAAASNDYYAAAPEAITNIGNAAASALSVHSSWIHWAVQQYVPQQVNNIYNILWHMINNAINQYWALYYDSIAYTNNQVAAAERYTSAVQNYLLSVLFNYYNSAINYTNQVVTAANQYTTDVWQTVERDLHNDFASLQKYATDLHSDAVTRVNAAVLLAQAEIAALLAYVTITFVPGAIEANNLVMNELTAVEAALFWERVATVSNANLVQLVLIDPTGIWDTDEVSEIPPLTIPTAIGETISALRLPMDFISKAGIPLYRNLKQFGEDTSKLDGVITTVVLGGLLAAAIAAPEDTAGLIATTVAGPLNQVAVQLVDLLTSL